MPGGKFNLQFNPKPLKKYLKEKGIIYMHFKNEFGARHENERVLNENSKVDFERFRKTSNFHEGVKRVGIGVSEGYKIALMCS